MEAPERKPRTSCRCRTRNSTTQGQRQHDDAGESLAQLLERHPEVDGVVAASDQIARGALEMLREFGRDVPGDVAVVSFDNWEVLTTQARPTISSVDFGLQDLGRAAARAIFETLDGSPPAPGVRHCPTRLLVRGSTVRSRS